jgi:hypothetical protein
MEWRLGGWTFGFDFMCLLLPLPHLPSWRDAELSEIIEDRFKDGDRVCFLFIAYTPQNPNESPLRRQKGYISRSAFFISQQRIVTNLNYLFRLSSRFPTCPATWSSLTFAVRFIVMAWASFQETLNITECNLRLCLMNQRLCEMPFTFLVQSV